MGSANDDDSNNPKVFGLDTMMTADAIPKAFVSKMLETTERFAEQRGYEKEREENVCRLLASGMSVDGVSLILKIRVDEVRDIERSNAKDKIPEYTRTYKSRAKSKRTLRSREDSENS